MEKLDVLDENGTATGIIKDRSEVHRDGDWHRAVHVWIVNGQNEILLQKRSSEIDLFKNLWDISLAGHVQSGEKSREAAKRELREELNIKARDDELKFVETYQSRLKDGADQDNQFCDVYLLRREIDLRKIKKQKKEVAATAFFPIKEFKERLLANPEQFVPRAEEYKKMLVFFGF